MPKSAHEAVLKGECHLCHDAHASNHRGLLKGPMTQVCNACHEKMGGANSKYQHGPFAGGLCMGCHQNMTDEEVWDAVNSEALVGTEEHQKRMDEAIHALAKENAN